MRRRRRDPDALPAFVRPLTLIMVCGLIIVMMIHMLTTPPERQEKLKEDLPKEEKYEVTYDRSFMQKGLYFTEEVIKEKGSEEILKIIEQSGFNAVVVEADYKADIQKAVSELFTLLSEKNIYLIVRLSYVDTFGMTGDKEQALGYCIKAADAGADEINLDYVGDAEKGRTEFIKYIYEGISTYSIKLSADFYVPMEEGDDELSVMAAELSEMFAYLDNVCPVLYPSYYEFEGSTAIYEKTIQLIEKFEELLVLSGYDKNVKVRPCLQAFDGSMLEDYSIDAAEAVHEAVRALEDCRMGSYVLYNPKGEYEY